MTLSVRAPFTAHVVALSEVPDPVFASGVVGEGCALVPTAAEDCITVHSPINGIVTKLKPHAAIVTSTRGVSILVHLGIDTVSLHGKGFAPLLEEGDVVTTGGPPGLAATPDARGGQVSVLDPIFSIEDPA